MSGQKSADSRGHRITYRVRASEASDRPIVLLHGWGSAGIHWYEEGYVGRLASLGPVVTIDLLGHGASDRPHDPGSYSLEGMAEDVHAVLAAERIDRAHLWGYSMGGYAAWTVAQIDDERLESLVLGGCAAGLSRDGEIGADPGVPAHLQEQADVLATGDWDGFWTVAGGPRPEWAGQWEAVNDPKALSAAMTGLLAGGITEGGVPDVPVRSYVGEHDLFAPAVEEAAAVHGWPLLVVAGADHLTVAAHVDEVLAFVEPQLRPR